MARHLFVGLLLLAGCSKSGDGGHGTDGGPTMPSHDMAGSAGGGGGGSNGGGGGGNSDGGVYGTLDVQPDTAQTLTYTLGQPAPTVQYTATIGGQAANVAWSIDRGDLGSIGVGPAANTTFTASGTVAGTVTITAGYNGVSLKRTVTIVVNGASNGADPNNPVTSGQIAPSDPTQLNSGGGVGGVGGEGLGVAVTDTGTLQALGAAPTDTGVSSNLKLLYPYDGTVFPRGILAPLVMWSWTPGDADAILLSLKTQSGNFSWSGTYGPPSYDTANGVKFVRHPIPQDVWAAATNTAGGADKLIMTLVVAKGGVAYGPLTQTWTIAPGRVSGTIYYNSYGTNLAKNQGGALGGDKTFGGAVLSIRVGDTGPKLAAGSSTGTSSSGCRVCHSVAADGSRLLVQDGGNYAISTPYDLTPTGTTADANLAASASATFAGLYPDGSQLLSQFGALESLPAGATLSTNIATAVPNVSGNLNLGTPAFSPDKTKVVFNPYTYVSTDGNGNRSWTPQRKLQVASYDAGTNTFGTPVTVVDDSGNANAVMQPGWGAFMPDSKSIVYHHQTKQGLDGNGAGQLYTRKGAYAQIAWTNVSDTTQVTTLNELNGLDSTGTSYLPKLDVASAVTCKADGATVNTYSPDHADDASFNYEPTVSPVASGGYAWVVFTSRRMYGNEATIPPFCSDPRGIDLISNITTKKLWVAAIDLNAPPGADASHPAFYLPAQELLAGNARGFWVLDPCRSDGSSCSSGDQCCGGFCEPNGSNGALICSDAPPNNSCSNLGDKCAQASDCCDSTNLCINGFCSLQPIT